MKIFPVGHLEIENKDDYINDYHRVKVETSLSNEEYKNTKINLDIIRLVTFDSINEIRLLNRYKEEFNIFIKEKYPEEFI